MVYYGRHHRYSEPKAGHGKLNVSRQQASQTPQHKRADPTTATVTEDLTAPVHSHLVLYTTNRELVVYSEDV